jgi:hypothetical protein
MQTNAVKLAVIAPLAIECEFWPEDGGWSGVCYEFPLTIRASSFEDAKRDMGGALQAQIESILRKHKQEHAA